MLLNPYLDKWLVFQNCWGSRNSYQERHLNWFSFYWFRLYSELYWEGIRSLGRGGQDSVKAEGTESISIQAARTFSLINTVCHNLDLWHDLFPPHISTSVVFVALNRRCVFLCWDHCNPWVPWQEQLCYVNICLDKTILYASYANYPGPNPVNALAIVFLPSLL